MDEVTAVLLQTGGDNLEELARLGHQVLVILFLICQLKRLGLVVEVGEFSHEHYRVLVAPERDLECLLAFSGWGAQN